MDILFGGNAKALTDQIVASDKVRITVFLVQIIEKSSWLKMSCILHFKTDYIEGVSNSRTQAIIEEGYETVTGCYGYQDTVF
ncbi:MAG: hypothetical protein D3910_17330 [Candidatus Electrothrix sp. ATG2]|nr:hypothetical protein [Candidatus Electrothrix sp. ATG2]